MKKLTTFVQKWGALILTPIALALASQTVNVACSAWFHQPEVPKGMEKFKKQR